MKPRLGMLAQPPYFAFIYNIYRTYRALNVYIKHYSNIQRIYDEKIKIFIMNEGKTHSCYIPTSPWSVYLEKDS